MKSAGGMHAGTFVISKADPRYWVRRLVKWHNAPNYGVQIQFRGRRLTFTLRTANKHSAAAKAAAIYSDLVNLGVEETLARHRAPVKQLVAEKPATVATIGKWIEAARGVSDSNPATFSQYAASLRLIGGQILAVRKTKKRFGPGKGGAKAYRAGIDAVSLEILTEQAVQRWRLAYVAQAKNPAHERSRMTSANSTLRQARSLFADKIVRFLPDMLLPSPRPFAHVQFFPRQNARYFSRIDPKALFRAAQSELAESDSPAFIALVLALTGGLRRSEIDSLLWHQLDFDRALIRLEPTETARLKTADSRAEVPLPPRIAAILQGFKAKASGTFVIEADGGKFGPRVWGRHYRADAVFTRLNHWLRKHGVTARKPLHELRKELGAMITTEHGIYAASRVLRHSTVTITGAHYSDLKSRPIVDVTSWLQPENVIELPTQRKSVSPAPGRKRKRASSP
jgi:integrase